MQQALDAPLEPPIASPPPPLQNPLATALIGEPLITAEVEDMRSDKKLARSDNFAIEPQQ